MSHPDRSSEISKGQSLRRIAGTSLVIVGEIGGLLLNDGCAAVAARPIATVTATATVVDPEEQTYRYASLPRYVATGPGLEIIPSPSPTPEQVKSPLDKYFTETRMDDGKGKTFAQFLREQGVSYTPEPFPRSKIGKVVEKDGLLTRDLPFTYSAGKPKTERDSTYPPIVFNTEIIWDLEVSIDYGKGHRETWAVRKFNWIDISGNPGTNFKFNAILIEKDGKRTTFIQADLKQ